MASVKHSSLGIWPRTLVWTGFFWLGLMITSNGQEPRIPSPNSGEQAEKESRKGQLAGLEAYDVHLKMGNRMIRYLAFILFFFVSCALSAQTIDNLAAVKIIHIGDLGSSDRVEIFRSLLGKELSARGFMITESENADTTISGVLTVGSQEQASAPTTGRVIAITPLEQKSYVHCKAFLKNRDGVILWKWEGETGSPRFWEKIVLEPVGNQAFKLAAALEKDYKKALKKKVLVCPKGHAYSPSAGYKICPLDGLPLSAKK